MNYFDENKLTIISPSGIYEKTIAQDSLYIVGLSIKQSNSLMDKTSSQVIGAFNLNVGSSISHSAAFNTYKHFLFYQERKEEYYITGFKNLIKKNNFLQLSLEFSGVEDEENEFESIIENNPDKYIVDIKSLDEEDDLHIVSEIVKKVGVSLNVDDVSEIFSIDTHCILNAIKDQK